MPQSLYTYQELKKKYPFDQKIPYNILLSTKDWRNYRIKIINRDNYQCQECNNIESDTDFENSHPDIKALKLQTILLNLQVHHKYYVVINKQLILPWEYIDDIENAVITVCKKCHLDIHLRLGRMPVYTLTKARTLEALDSDNYKLCTRCDGKGYRPDKPGWSKHDHAECYNCCGTGIIIDYKK